MDPLCHTLVGLSIAHAGLRERTALATTALVIGANIPDLDAVTYFAGDSLFWRRGWTHGVVAMALWPFVVAGLLVLWARLSRASLRDRPPPSGRALVWISAIGVWSHPLLDFLNNYGVRWLMPFEDRWFYGDALFIVEPVIWLSLIAGLIASWAMGASTGRGRRPARIALTLVSTYAVGMLILGQAGRPIVDRQFRARGVAAVAGTMVSPVLGGVSRRYVVAGDGSQYYVAGFRWWPEAALDAQWRVIATNDGHPAVERARLDPAARGFVTWSRFPFYVVEDAGNAYLVTMDDARYAPVDGYSWAAVQVTVEKDGP